MTDNEQKKTEPETFEAKIRALIHTEMVSESATGHGGVLQITERTILDGDINSALDLCREADQRIAQLTTDLAQSRADLGLCAQSVPIEADELIDFLEARLGMGLLPADIKDHDRLLTRYERLFKEGKQNAPIELVELVEELIVACEKHKAFLFGMNCSSAPLESLITRAQATIERWKV